MREGIQSLPGRVAVAVVATAVALLLRFALWPVFGDSHPYLTFYPAVMVAGLLGGLLAGVTASALGALAANYFLVKPHFSLHIEDAADFRAQSGFLVAGVLMSLLAEVILRTRGRAVESATESQRLLAQLDGLMNHARAGFAFFNDRLEVERLNPYLAGLGGHQVADLIGRPLREVLPLAPLEVERLVRTVFETGQSVLEHEISAPGNGGPHFWILELYPIQAEGRPVARVALILVDISERKRLEQELRRHADELAANDRRKDVFLAMLAHELRNPLAPLQTAADVIALGEQLPSELGLILQRQVRQLARIVDDLLDTARISRGQLDIRCESVTLAYVVESAVQTVQGLLQERGHTLTVRLPPTPPDLYADPVRLAQALGNLLHNAARYTEPGGKITLTAEQRGDEVVIRVTDTGIGIRPELIGSIFELFQRGDQVPGQAAAGLGLGLTLVRQLVEMHGGRVSASSPGPGLGSTFEMRLPVRPVQPPVETTASPKQASAKGLRVLVVDDNDDAAQAIAMLLGIQGHAVQVANDGPEALRIAENWKPQVAFLDIGLPGGMDGYELARRVRAKPGGAEVRLVALTGLGQAEDRRRGAEAGFDHYLVKPAGLDELTGVLVSE